MAMIARASLPASSPVNRTPQGKRRATAVIAFIQRLTVPSGTGQGQSFKLLPSQKRFIRDIYEPHIGSRRAVRRAILSMARKNGKALALHTPIPTPDGWTTMGDLNEGDTLFDETGAPCRVTFATPVQLNRQCYRVLFSDGSSIVADADHQWTVHSRSRHDRKVTMTTRQMLHDVVLPYSRPNRVERNYSIPVAAPIRGATKSLPVPPYTLGAWLGDGCAASARICSSEPDHAILEEIAAEGTPVRRQHDGATCTWWSFSDGSHDRTKGCTQKALRQLGVLHDKHVPASYQRAPIEQRMALLQGLMDTDGFVSKAGQCEFVSTQDRLARDVLELVRGLGFKASLHIDRARVAGLDCGPRYRIQFWAYADRPVFRLARKRSRLKPPDCTRNARLYITAIEPTDSVPVRCIQVDSPSSLFLAGDGFTPTHNTALIAAIALAHLVGPEAIVHGEIYSAANDRDQAAIVFKFARQIVELEPELRKEIEVIPSTKTMVARRTGSVYRAVSAEAGTKHGYLPSVVIYDELAQAKNRDLYDVLDTSFGAREEPLFITISTQSNDPEHILSRLIDDGLSGVDPTIVCHLYAADDDCDLDDQEQWAKANPALGKFRDREDLVAAIRKAKRMPAEEPKVRNLFLNQRVAPVAALISRAEWMGCVGAAALADGEEIYLALDLSATLDLTALVAGSAEDPCRIAPFFWKPREYLNEHSARDFGTGSYRYAEWVEAGYLFASPGRTIDPEAIALFIAELTQRYKVRGLAYDRWRINDLLREFDRIGLQAHQDGDKGDGLRLVPWGQGYKDMGPAIDAFETAVIERKLLHPNSPILNWNIANAVATMDPAGNRKLDKDKARFRIDGAVATAMLMGLRSRDRSVKPVDIEALIG
jgi:phage terminase large subunit-like protein